MIDPIFERHAADCKELLALWQTYHEFFNIGKNSDNITPEKEDQFLRLKSRIAELHDSLLDALDTDQRAIGQGVLDIIGRSITLKHLGKLSTADIKKMEIEWHECYLVINDTIGSLDDKRAEIAPISEAQYKARKAGAAASQKVTSFFTSSGFKLTVGAAAIFFVTFGVQMLGIFDWDNVAKAPGMQTPYRWTKAAVRKFWNEDSPWPMIIDDALRKSYASFPSGLKRPEVQNRSKDEILGKLPPSVAAAMKEAAEYRMETTGTEKDGAAEIHTFRFNETAQAKKVMDAYGEVRRAEKEVFDRVRLVRDVNIVTVLTSGSPGLLNAVYVDVYNQKD